MLQRLLACVLMVILAAFSASGCTATPDGRDGDGGEATSSADATASALARFEDDVEIPPEMPAPPPPMLRNPETAVYSYMLWISYAYRVSNSDVTTLAWSPMEEVRVNSYVQYNLQEGRALDQQLVAYEFKDVQGDDTTATVTTEESWKYRYIDAETGKYSTPAYDVTYDTTYTVVNDGIVGWRVEKVQATPRNEVK